MNLKDNEDRTECVNAECWCNSTVIALSHEGTQAVRPPTALSSLEYRILHTLKQILSFLIAQYFNITS